MSGSRVSDVRPRTWEDEQAAANERARTTPTEGVARFIQHPRERDGRERAMVGDALVLALPFLYGKSRRTCLTVS